MRDNADLQDRTQQMEHLILQLQSETDTIGKNFDRPKTNVDFSSSSGDYISLYQQQRQQLHRRYQEKDDYIKQLTQDRLNLQVNFLRVAASTERRFFLVQRKLAELESLLLRGLPKATTNESEKLADENGESPFCSNRSTSPS